MRPFDLRLLRLLPEARGAVVRLGLLGIAGGALAIATAFALTRLVVAVVDREPLGGPMVALAVIFALRMVVGPIAEWTAADAGALVSTSLRQRLLRAWLTRSADERPEPARGFALATAGATTVEPYFARYLPALISAAALPTLAIGTLLVIDWPSALICVLTVPLLPFFAALIGKSTEDATARRWHTNAALSGHFLDVVRGLPTLVGYNRARTQTATIRTVSLEHRDATMGTLRIAFLSSAALELLATISVAIVAVTAGVRLAWGTMPLATAMTAILLSPEAYWPIRRVGAEYHNAADGAQAVADILTELARTSTTEQPDQADPGDALSYRYPGTERDILRGVNLDVSPGLTVVTGPSGAGKTTLLEVLAGLRTPTTGQVPARTCHLVTQRPFITSGTVRDNLALAQDASDARLWEVLDEVGLGDDVRAMDEGLDTRLGDDGFGLSAGQRAKLALARALLSSAEVVLLDEPTAHLDDASAALAHRAIGALAERRPVVAVTHRPELAALADRRIEVGS